MNFSSTYKTFLLLLISFTFFSGCKNYKDIFTNQSEIQNSPKILFLNYSIENTLNGNRTIQFINKKIANGKLKNKTHLSINNGVAADLILTELDKKSKTLNSILIKNPLVRTVEFINDSLQLQTKEITLDKAQFSLRLQLKTATKYITISNFAENKPLIKTKIY